MRRLMNDIVAIIMGVIIGIIILQTTNEDITGSVEYQPDGEIVVIYSDDSSILINREYSTYIMWAPETEDYEYQYDTEEELMNAIEAYHGPVTDYVYPEGTTLNPNGYAAVEKELDKVSDEVLELLDSTGLEIYYSNKAIEKQSKIAGFDIAGYYNYNNNNIVVREDIFDIEYTLLHELGHAIDNHLGLYNNQTIIDSYMNQEVVFSHNSDYYYSNIYEYIAESINYYCNDLLPHDTDIYQELNYILGE